MKSTTVHIDELRLRASGLTPEQGRRLGEIVAQRLSGLQLVGNQSRQIPSVHLRLRPSDGGSLERMADHIVAGIRRTLV
jgi:hypothetical protein